MDFLQEDKYKADNMNSLIALKDQIQRAVTDRDDADTSLKDDAVCLAKGRAYYTAEKAKANATITQAQANLTNLKNKIDANTDATYSATEKAEYSKVVTDSDNLVNGV